MLTPQEPHPLAGRPLLLRVAWCRPLEGARALAGSFLVPLTDEEARALAGV